MSQVVPLQPVPNQTEQIVLNNQNCQINVYQTDDALFFDLYVNDEVVKLGAIAQNLNKLIRGVYLGFIGDFSFVDTQGTNDPVYTGLGSRYQLLYYLPSELT